MSYRQQGYRPQTRQAQPISPTSQRVVRAVPQRAPAARGGGPRPRGQKPRRSHPIRAFLVLALFALIATAVVTIYTVYEEISHVERANTFYPGVYIDDVELYGYTPQEAYTMLLSRARAQMDNWSLSITYQGQSWTLNPDKLGMSRSLEAIVQEEVNKAFFIGRGDGDLVGIINRFKAVAAMKATPYRAYTSGIEQNTGVIDTILEEIARVVYQPPVDATRIFDTTRRDAMRITDEVYGQEADIAALKTQIIQKVSAMESGAIQVPVIPVRPAITAEMLSGDIVKLASFATRISTQSSKERNANIQVGCERFNGKVFEAGAKISFNDVVGTRTVTNGFFEAEELVYGVYEMGVGGGICQVSTTLYNAVIQAGLEIVSRTNHSVPVRYADRGADATVYDGRIDFVFRNNTGAPIYITAVQTTRDKQEICLIEIYGRPDPNGFTYRLQHVEEEIPIPEKIEKIRDKNGTHATYSDEQVEVPGSVGYRVKSYLVTMNASGNVLKVDEKPLTESYYKPIPNKIYTGIRTRK